MTVTINEAKFEFKTAFSELSVNEYLNLISCVNLPIIERVSKYTNIPENVLKELRLENFLAISEQVSFIERDEILLAMVPVFNGKDVGLESYGKIEKVKELIKQDTLIKALPKITELYTGKEITSKPLLEVWGECFFYLKSISGFFEKFKRLSLHEYTDEELEADVEALSIYKHYPVVFRIGAERGMTNDEVLALPAIEIYMQMMYEFDRSEYEKRYGEIMKQKQEHLAKVK